MLSSVPARPGEAVSGEDRPVRTARRSEQDSVCRALALLCRARLRAGESIRASNATNRQCFYLLSPLGRARRRAGQISPCAQRDGRTQTLRGSYVTPILYKRFKASANLHGSGEVAKGASQAAYVP